MRSDKTYKTICVEGNIGSGKTTLINKIASRRKIRSMTEPVKQWSKSGLLREFYENPKAKAFELQNIIYDAYKTKNAGKTCIQDRSIYSAYYVFTALLLKLGYLEQTEYDKLEKRFKEVLPQTERISLVIYVKTPPDVVLQRIKKRGRKAESSITVEYLRELDKMYENIFIELADKLNIATYVVDGTMKEEEIFQEVNSFLDTHETMFQNYIEKVPKPLAIQYSRSDGFWKPEKTLNESNCEHCKKAYKATTNE